MEDKDYDVVIGKLTRLRVWLKPGYHVAIDELISALVDEAEGLKP